MIENPLFAQALAGLDPDMVPTTPRSADLLFEDDLPVRLTLHPDGKTVLVDAFAYDASDLADEASVVAGRLMLQLNGLAMAGRPFTIGLTSAGLVAVTVRQALSDVTADALADPIAYAAEQARAVRILLQTLGSVDGGLSTFSA